MYVGVEHLNCTIIWFIQVEKIQKALKSVKELNQWNDIQELKVSF